MLRVMRNQPDTLLCVWESQSVVKLGDPFEVGGQQRQVAHPGDCGAPMGDGWWAGVFVPWGTWAASRGSGKG